jgi:tetratricopeptide (TPR) repeat protein
MASWFPRLRRSHVRLVVIITHAVLLSLILATGVTAQVDDLGDGSADPIKLFERGQGAHAHGDLERAVDLYEQALKLRPEFPEAEFQLGSALVSLNRLPEAEAAFRRSIELRKDWALPYSSLGSLLSRNNRDREAEPLLRQAIKLDPQNTAALRALAEVRLRAGDAQAAADLAKRATQDPDAPVSTWILRAMTERALGDKAGAKASLDHALRIDPKNVVALIERSDMRAAEADYERAIEDLKAAEHAKPGDKQILSRLLDLYQRTGKEEEAGRLAQSLGIVNTTTAVAANGEIKVIGTAAEIEAANDADPVKARQALEILLQKNPRHALLLARLGASYRTDDPARSLEFYRRANEIDPKNPDYAIGYAAALVQSRHFEDAVRILRNVLSTTPNNYVAHANLATALYELKRFAEALAEYKWLLEAKPDLVVTYYFVATAHDKLGQFEEALANYELFMSRADPKVNELEIEKVKLRLPPLKRQIKLGQGVKRKP